MKQEYLYLKTAFCCMACDGDIADQEINLLKNYISKKKYFNDIDVNQCINNYINDFNQLKSKFLSNYLESLHKTTLDITEEKTIISIAIEMINADEKIEYTEISFFKKIRKLLNISDEQILEIYPDIEEYLLPDIEIQDNLNIDYAYFKPIIIKYNK